MDNPYQRWCSLSDTFFWKTSRKSPEGAVFYQILEIGQQDLKIKEVFYMYTFFMKKQKLLKNMLFCVRNWIKTLKFSKEKQLFFELTISNSQKLQTFGDEFDFVFSINCEIRLN